MQNRKTLTFAAIALFPAFAPDARALPNTPECQEYANYASTAGATGTYGPLIELYNVCMNSAYESPQVQQYECADGAYITYYNGQPRCYLPGDGDPVE